MQYLINKAVWLFVSVDEIGLVEYCQRYMFDSLSWESETIVGCRDLIPIFHHPQSATLYGQYKAAEYGIL